MIKCIVIRYGGKWECGYKLLPCNSNDIQINKIVCTRKIVETILPELNKQEVKKWQR